MSTPLRVIPAPSADESWWDTEPGDTWRCHYPDHQVAGRAACMVVRLPERAWVWHTNERATGGGNFWTVTGELPAITVTPSINIGPEIWHGFITDGHLVQL